MKQIYEVTFYLKSGQTLTIQVADLILEKMRDSKELVGVKWESLSVDHLQLRYLDVDSISAITGRLVATEGARDASL